MVKLIPFAKVTTSPVFDHPRRDRLVAGDPARTTWEHYANASGEVSCGVWACEIGAWRIEFADSSDEFFHVLEGRIRITDENGQACEFGIGEACVIPAGFKGVFEVLEPVRKHYVVVKRKV